MDDRQAIIEALAALAAALDGRDWDTLRTVFTADATGYGRTGVEDIVAVVRGHLGGCGPTQHLLGNHRVDVDGDRARSTTYARVYHRGAGTRQDRFFECLGEYHDRWLRTGSGWRLRRRDFDMRITLGDFAVLQPG